MDNDYFCFSRPSELKKQNNFFRSFDCYITDFRFNMSISYGPTSCLN